MLDYFIINEAREFVKGGFLDSFLKLKKGKKK